MREAGRAQCWHHRSQERKPSEKKGVVRSEEASNTGIQFLFAVSLMISAKGVSECGRDSSQSARAWEVSCVEHEHAERLLGPELQQPSHHLRCDEGVMVTLAPRMFAQRGTAAGLQLVCLFIYTCHISEYYCPCNL